jgi:hypothetical protein
MYDPTFSIAISSHVSCLISEIATEVSSGYKGEISVIVFSENRKLI